MEARAAPCLFVDASVGASPGPALPIGTSPTRGSGSVWFCSGDPASAGSPNGGVKAPLPETDLLPNARFG